VQQFVDALEERTTGGQELLATTASTVPTYFLGGILTLFIMSYGPRVAQSAVDQLRSAEQRRRVTQVVQSALPRARRAVLFTAAEGLIVGLIVWGVAGLLDIPAPTAIGLFAGVLALLPHVGIVVGNLPLILLLLALRSDLSAIVAAVVVIACQLGDSYVVRRRIAMHSVHIGLLVPWVVALVGYAVYGVGGAAYGLAFAVFGLALLDEIGRPDHEATADAAVDPPTDPSIGSGGLQGYAGAQPAPRA
jgi:predicted PurR-regulated permease PerM